MGKKARRNEENRKKTQSPSMKSEGKRMAALEKWRESRTVRKPSSCFSRGKRAIQRMGESKEKTSASRKK